MGRLSALQVLTCFVFNDAATTEIYTLLYTLSLHDALPICAQPAGAASVVRDGRDGGEPRLVALRVPGVRLEEPGAEAPEHGGQPRAAAERHDPEVGKGPVAGQART